MPLAPSAAQQAPKTLYQRLGGYDAIALVTDDFVGRLAGDPRFARFFAGLSTDSKIRLRQHVVDQLCQVAGGPCFYTGRTMKVSHSGLGITGAEWDAAAGHLSASLDKYHVPAKEKGEVIAAVVKLRPDIVEK
jgi:hemoglobin